MPVPVFTAGETLDASEMNAVGLWRVTGCTVSSAGGTAATASNGVITVGSGNTSVEVITAFSSNFDNYRVVISNVKTDTTDSNFRFQLGPSSVSGYNTSYYGALIYAGSVAPTYAEDNNSAVFSFIGGGSMTGQNKVSTFVDVASPNLAQPTTIISGPFAKVNATNRHFGQYSGAHASTSQFTGFILSASAGTLTGGTVRVYGYRN